MQKELDALVRAVAPLDRSAMTAAEEHQARLAKPPGSLGRLEELSIQLAGITGRVHNALNKKQLLVFAADNGVVAEGEGGATDVVTVKGTIRSMNQAVIEGNTHFYLTVEGEDGSIFDFALPGLLDIVGYKVGDEINFTYVEAAGSNVSPAYEILGEGGKASENASGEPEDDVVQDNGAAQTPADVASGEDTEKVA